MLTLSILVACGGDGPRREGDGEPSNRAGASSEGLADVRVRFLVGGEPLVRASIVERFDRVGDSLVARLPESAKPGVAGLTTVKLPALATGAFEVKDVSTGLAISVTRMGAAAVDAQTPGAYVVYRGALGGADVIHRVHAEGTEDYVHFAARPAREELRYRVNVERAHGLRLVDGVLELMDAAGYPRLRMTAPLAVDADGQRVALSTRVEGCAVDTSPAAPWERARVAPGAPDCEVVVEWTSRTYPLIVDPSWVSTGSMAQARAGHTASPLPDGSVLVVGGSGSLKSAERWSNGTFSSAGSCADGRYQHTANTLPDGSVLVIGGGQTSAERWSNGTFAPAGTLGQTRSRHTATTLPDGSVLVVGGTVLPTALRWSNGSFSPAGSLAEDRASHTATLLTDGTVLVVGGFSLSASVARQSAERWSSGAFSAAGSLSEARWDHSATALADGSVLYAGGVGTSSTLQSAERWLGGVFSPAGSLATPRSRHTATALPDGTVLVVGGDKNAERWNNGAFAPAGVLAQARPEHSASALPSGSVLVVGGGPPALATAELYSLELAAGAVCVVGADCASGFCTDGVCCDTACPGTCKACTAAKKGGGSDGVCGNVADGLDLDGECAAGGAGACQGDFVCDGTGTCRSSKQGQGVSVPMACPSETEQYNPDTCSASGAVISNGKSPCAAYKCKGNACGTTCVTSADCLAPYQCAGGSCGDGKQDGASCTTDAECKNLHCTDGVCCNKACKGECEACVEAKTGQPDGTCKPIPANKDPDDECTKGGTTCGASGFCDGAGACSKAASQGTTCGVTSCVGTAVQGQVCDGNGACGNTTTPVACSSGYVCVSGACPASCVDGKECAGSHFCSTQTNTCIAKIATGGACNAAVQCQSAFCADGVCCENDCAGSCRSCNGNANQSGVNGKCENVKDGTDPRNKCDEGSDLCGPDGLCGKTGECRKFRPGGEACGAQTCNGTTQESSACDGFGMCQKTSLPCGSFACDPATKACKKSCASDADCVAGAQCAKASGQCGAAVTTCASATEEKTTSGQVSKCPAGYACTGNKCNTKCSTNAECDIAGGFTCMGTECNKGGAGGAGGGSSAGAGGGSASAAAGGGSASAGAGGGSASAGAGLGGASAGGSGSPVAAADDSGGCGCDVPGRTRPANTACFAVTVGLAAMLLRRRGPRRSRRVA